MSDLAEKMATMRQGDYFHLTAWRASPAQRLLPTLPNSPTFPSQLAALIAAGVSVRVAVWYTFGSSLAWLGPMPQYVKDNVAFVKEVLAAGGQAILDARLARPYHSHHQKTCVLSSGGVHYAYVGGVDVCSDRWDTPSHTNVFGRSQEEYEGWHDLHTVIRGPVVAQVWQNFADRWNDPNPPHRSRVPGARVPAPITSAPPNQSVIGTHNVQVLRTLAAGIYPFARRGEQTVRCGYERAIDNAQHYIYIEDQYVWPSSLVSGLRDAAARGVKIILVTSHEFTTPGPLRAAHNFMRQEVLQTLRSVHPENVLTFHLQRLDRGAEVYVHAKLMLVDDCYAVIGSANMNFRSQTSDSELSIAVVDDETRSSTMNGVPVQVCRFAAELRIALWAEHLGITDKQVLADPIEALELWPKPPANDNALPAQHHHAVWHDVPTPRRRGVGLLVNLMNPAASYPPTKSLV